MIFKMCHLNYIAISPWHHPATSRCPRRRSQRVVAGSGQVSVTHGAGGVLLPQIRRLPTTK